MFLYNIWVKVRVSSLFQPAETIFQYRLCLFMLVFTNCICWVLFFYTHCCFLLASLSDSMPGKYETERKPMEFVTTVFLGSQDPQLICLLLSTFRCFLVCFIYNVHGFQLYVGGGIGKSTFSWKWKSLRFKFSCFQISHSSEFLSLDFFVQTFFILRFNSFCSFVVYIFRNFLPSY